MNANMHKDCEKYSYYPSGILNTLRTPHIFYAEITFLLKYARNSSVAARAYSILHWRSVDRSSELMGNTATSAGY